MTDDVEIRLSQREIDRLPLLPAVRAELMRYGRRAAAASAARAPRLSGRGAASIRPEYILDGDTPEVRASWDREHFYMYFHQVGTRFLPARPFMTTGGRDSAAGPEYQSEL